MIYKLHTDMVNYQTMTIDNEDFLDLADPFIGEAKAMRIGKENLSMAGFWKPLEVTLFENEGTTEWPDIGEWKAGTLLLNAKAYSVLSDLLSPYGEFLECTMFGEPCYLFNCLNNKVHSEDNIKYRKHGDLFVEVESLVFPESECDHIFKAENKVSFDVFCSERVKSVCESAGLRGVKFSSDLASMF